MFFHYATAEGEVLYHDVFSLHVACAFDEAAFRSSIEELIAAHPVLRTSFQLTGLSQPLQLVHRDGVIRYRYLRPQLRDVEHIEAFIRGQIEKLEHDRFDLRQQSLIRFTVIQRSEAEYQLLIDAHHMILDGWSMASLLAQLFHGYLRRLGLLPQTAGRSRPATSFKDFIRAELQEIGNEQAAGFWRDYLEEHEYRPLRFRPQGEGRRVSAQRLSLAAYGHDLQALARAEKVSLRDVLLAVHMRVCALVEGAAVASSTVVTNGRLEVAGADEVAGLFLNSVPLRVPIMRQSWRELIGSVSAELRSVMRHRRYPFAEIAKAHGSAISDISFNFVHFHVYKVLQGVAGFQILAGEVIEKTNFRLSITFHLGLSGNLELILSHDESAIDRHSARRLAAYYEKALQLMLADPDCSCLEAALLSAEELAELGAMQRGTPVPQRGTIQALFESQAGALPEQVAVECGSSALSYRELNEAANRLAHHLRGSGVHPEAVIGVCMERSIDMIVAILAVLKAGAAYLPLDPGYPVTRLQYMVRDSAAVAIVSDRATGHVAELLGKRAIVLDDEDTRARIAAHSCENPDLDGPADGLAYVMYTSGSTGKPKGVMIAHQGVTRLVIDPGYVQLDRDCRILQLSSVAFDAATFEIWGALLNGGRLVLYPHRDIDYGKINALIERCRIDVMWLTARLFDAWSRELPQLTHRLHVLTGGDVVNPQSVAQAYRRSPLIVISNGYGPTENTTFTCCYQIPRNLDERSIPLGRPIPGTGCYVLGPGLQLVPPGTVGELYIAGLGLARGYLGAPELTSEKFLRNPFPADAQDRLYKSGDLVRQLPGGELEFIGRVDDQVKVRGFRVELGEIEHCLSSLEEVDSCLVRVYEAASGQRHLVAYVVLRTGGQGAGSDWSKALRQKLREQLPDYMVPSTFLALAQWPLTPNGKIDTRRLPSAMADDVTGDYHAPVTAAERKLVDIWADLLNLAPDRLSVEANFFELGGDSILSIQAVSRAAREGLHFSVKDLFTAAGIRQLAEVATGTSTAGQHASVGEVPLLPAQIHFFATRALRESAGSCLLLTTPKEFDARALAAIVAGLLERHDALRLAFPAGAEGAARCQPFDPASVERAMEFEQCLDASFDGLHALEGRLKRSLNPAEGLVFKAALIGSPAASEGRLLLVAHPLVIDITSWRIVGEEIEQLYGRWRAGEMPSEQSEQTSYRQYAADVGRYARGDASQAELDYWTRSAGGSPVRVVAPPSDAGGVSAGEGRVRFELAPVLTGQLLADCNRPYRTRTIELLLSALLMGLRRGAGMRSIRLEMHSDGRSAPGAQPDLNRTVGPLSYRYPLALAIAQDDSIASTVAAVKEQFRAVPNGGIGYEILKSVRGAPELGMQPADLSFTYLDQHGPRFTPQGGFAVAAEASGRHEQREFPSLLCSVRDGRLELELAFDGRQYDRAAMHGLLGSIGRSLEQIAEHCLAAPRAPCTPADFPLASVSSEQLQSWAALTRDDHGGELEDLYPATLMQQGMLFHSALTVGSYVTQLAVSLDGLRPIEFQRAWDEVIRRHAILRTAFVGLDTGNAHQLVLSHVACGWHVQDLREMSSSQQQEVINGYLSADKTRGFIASQAPLMRMALFQLNGTQTRFIWSHHHALLDGWSLPVVLAEMIDCYQALVTGQPARLPEVRPYRDYVAWAQRQDAGAAREFWRERLKSASEPAPLPLGRASPARNRQRGALVENDLFFSSEQTHGILRLAQVTRTTINVILQAAWALLLFRYSGKRQVVFGSVVSGRPAQLSGVERIAGLFINTIPVIVDIDPQAQVAEWLQLLHTRQMECDAYSYLPLIEILRLTGHSQPLFDSLVVVENYPVDGTIGLRLREAGLATGELQVAGENSYGVALKADVSGPLYIKAEIYEDAIASSRQAQVLRHFRQLVLSLAAGASSRLDELQMLTEDELLDVHRQLDLRTRKYANDTLIHQLFERRASAEPRRIAVVDEQRGLTYGELNACANQLAHELIARGAGPDVLIGLHVERGVDMLVGILAILKAGSAYVPLAPDYPRTRLEYILQDAALSIVVTQGHLAAGLPGGVRHVLCQDDPQLQRQLAARSQENPRVPSLSARDLAYIIYTSGSTGQPKGVMIEHHNVVRLFRATAAEFDFTENDTWVLAHSFAFDFSVWEIWGALIHGGKLIVPSLDGIRDSQAFAELLERHEVSILNQTPTAFYSLMHEMLRNEYRHRLRYVIFGGEALNFQRLKPWLDSERHAGAQLVNMYGITETTVHTTIYRITQRDLDAPGSVIGRPLADLGAVICDETLQLCPPGATGELLVTGDGLARGYLRRADLTRQRFIELPHAGARFYRTGDLVRRLESGDLVYAGRIDDQVKIRGFRIELGEITNVLEKSPLVSAAHTDVQGEGADRRLIAYVVPAELDARPEDCIDGIRRWLTDQLPPYMIPASVLLMKALPLTVNGKIDRGALPKPDAPGHARSCAPPITRTQASLCAIWQAVLEREDVGIDDNFFEIGGHSLLATRVNSQLKDHFKVHIGFDVLFKMQTIRELAACIDEELKLDSLLHAADRARAGGAAAGEVVEI